MITANPYEHFTDYAQIRKDGGAPVIEVSVEYFMYMLEVLPPCKWYNSKFSESFHISERLTENIVEWLVRVVVEGEQERFFALAARDTLKHEDVRTKVQEFMAKEVTP